MRFDNWENDLAEYIASKAETPFAWGEHDCMAFSMGAVHVITGEDYFVPYRGQYDTKLGAARALREIGAGTLEATVDDKFTPLPGVAFAQRGDLALWRGCVGVVMGALAIFVGEDGTERIPTLETEKAWRVG
jgi:hypothetical protein